MALTKDQIVILSRRLGLIEALLPLTQQLVEPLMNEGMITALSPTDLAMTREILAAIKAVMTMARSKGTQAPNPKTLTRVEATSVYFATQALAGVLGQITRKTAALLADKVEGVAIPKTMKDGWETGLNTDLTEIDAALVQVPD